jgi:queuine/archaeosine tRNA-ribosyltransferase
VFSIQQLKQQTIFMIMNRLSSIELQNFHLELPLFFPSISSVKTNFRPIDYLNIICASRCPYFLISAYDIYNQTESEKTNMIDILNKMRAEGKIILLDSGNYESYWHKDKNWNIEKYNEILKNEFCTLCFSYEYKNIEEGKSRLIKKTIENAISNQKVTNGYVFPIIYAKWEDLDDVCCSVVKNILPKCIAIPERLLGAGIVTRVQKLRKIRNSLNELGFYTPIHLLGSGNPLALLLFTDAGADTFDGLEWCQTYIDKNTFLVHHFQFKEIFETNDHSINNYDAATLYGNIRTYQYINKLIQETLKNNEMENLLSKFFPVDFIKQLSL